MVFSKSAFGSPAETNQVTGKKDLLFNNVANQPIGFLRWLS